MNNICIYAEVIALARFFLGLLLSPQILNIQLLSPDWSWGCSVLCATPASSREGEKAEQGRRLNLRCMGNEAEGQGSGIATPAGSSLTHPWFRDDTQLPSLVQTLVLQESVKPGCSPASMQPSPPKRPPPPLPYWQPCLRISHLNPCIFTNCSNQTGLGCDRGRQFWSLWGHPR